MKLDPNSIIYNSLERFFAIFIFFAVTAFFDGGGLLASILFTIIPLAIFFGFISFWQYLYWRKFEYFFEDESLKIKSGIISTRNREVPLKRVQNIDVRENILQRSLDLAEVRFETAGGGTSEAVLKCVSKGDVEKLKNKVREIKGEKTIKEENEEEKEPIYKIDRKELAVLSLTSFSIVSVVAIFFTLVFGISGFVFQGDLDIDFERGWLVIATPVLIVISLLASWIINGLRNFFKYYGFELYLQNDSLEYNTGLLRKYSGKIPLDKLQSATIEENLFRRFLDYASLNMETAGYSASQKQDRGSEMTVPIAPRNKVYTVLEQVEQISEKQLNNIPSRARKRYFIRYTLLLTLIITTGYIAADLPQTTLATIPILTIIAYIGARKKHENIGYQVLNEEKYFVVMNGFWNRRTRYVPFYRIQNIIKTQTVLQRRWKLASLTADTAGSFISMRGFVVATDMDQEEAEKSGQDLFQGLQKALKEKRQQK